MLKFKAGCLVPIPPKLYDYILRRLIMHITFYCIFNKTVQLTNPVTF